MSQQRMRYLAQAVSALRQEILPNGGEPLRVVVRSFTRSAEQVAQLNSSAIRIPPLQSPLGQMQAEILVRHERATG